jgi:hypothetical protein
MCYKKIAARAGFTWACGSKGFKPAVSSGIPTFQKTKKSPLHAGFFMAG